MMQTLTDKIARLSEAIALEIKQIKEDLSGPALFIHISKTLDKVPEIKEIRYERKAGSAYKKTIVLNMQWKNQPLVKEIVLMTSEVFDKDDKDIDDSQYDCYIPYHSVILSQNKDTGVFDVLLCRKAYDLP